MSDTFSPDFSPEDGLVVVQDNDGTDYRCQVLDIFDFEDREYAVLQHLDLVSPSQIVMRFYEKEGQPIFQNIENDGEYEGVMNFLLGTPLEERHEEAVDIPDSLPALAEPIRLPDWGSAGTAEAPLPESSEIPEFLEPEQSSFLLESQSSSDVGSDRLAEIVKESSWKTLPTLREVLLEATAQERIEAACALSQISRKLLPELADVFPSSDTTGIAGILNLDRLGRLLAISVTRLVEAVLSDSDNPRFGEALCSLACQAGQAWLVGMDCSRSLSPLALLDILDRLNAGAVAARLGLQEAQKCGNLKLRSAIETALQTPSQLEEKLWSCARLFHAVGKQPRPPRPSPTVDVLVEALSSSQPGLRDSAALELMDADAFAIAPFARQISLLLSHPDAAAREQTARLLGHLGRFAALAQPPLIRALTDSSTTVRAAAVTALGSIGPAAGLALPALQKITEGEEPRLRELALCAIENIDPPFNLQRTL